MFYFIQKKETREFDCQTPTHIIDPCVDPNYEWNEWAMRRRLIQVVRDDGGGNDNNRLILDPRLLIPHRQLKADSERVRKLRCICQRQAILRLQSALDQIRRLYANI